MKPGERDAIRKRHVDAAYLAKRLPPFIKDWDNGEPMDASDLINAFTRSHGRGGRSTDGIAFALHAHEDMTKLLARLAELEGNTS